MKCWCTQNNKSKWVISVLAPVDVKYILTANEHNYDRIKLFDGGVRSHIAEPNAGKCREYEIHTRNVSRLKKQLIIKH